MGNVQSLKFSTELNYAYAVHVNKYSEHITCSTLNFQIFIQDFKAINITNK